MSFKATLSMAGKTFELLEYRCGFRQKRDIQGKPEAGVTGGIIKMLLDISEDDTFANWMVNPTKKENGKIVINRMDQGSKFKQIEFEGAYLVDLIESFVTDGDFNSLEWEETAFGDIEAPGVLEFIMDHHLRTRNSYIIYCRISAEKIKIDGVEHDNRWRDA